MSPNPDYGPGTPADPYPEYASPEEVEDIAGSTGSISDAVDSHDADAAAHADAGFAADTDITDAVDTHEAASDPHAAYTKQAEVDSTLSDHDSDVTAHLAAGFAVPSDISDAVDTHIADVDPHPGLEPSAQVATDIAAHSSDTTSIHGITDTSVLSTATTTATAVTNHSAASDPHGDRAYADGVASGLTVKDSVVAATTGNITLSGAQTIDGVSVVALDRVLVKAQTTTKDNGIYIAAAGAWARSTDADTTGEMKVGSFCYVTGGTVNATSSWVCNSAGTLATDPVLFTQFNSAGSVSAGAGLFKTGSTIDIVSGGGLTVAADTITVASNHGGSTHATATSNATNVSFPVVRPETYGAIGDGSTDDTAAVQAAIDAIPETGGTLALGPGAVYKLTAGSRTVTAASRTTSGSDDVHVFTYSGGNSFFNAGDVVNVRGTTVSSGTDNWNSTYLIKSQTTTTITCYANNQVVPGTWASGGTIYATAIYIRDKGGVRVQGASARSQGAASGSWLKSGTPGMVMVVAQKKDTTVMTHSGPSFVDVGFIDTAIDPNTQTGATAAWAAGTITVTKSSHGFSNGDNVAILNSASSPSNSNAINYNGSYTVANAAPGSFTVPLASDPGVASVTCALAYETFPTAKSPTSVGLVIVGTTRWYAERNNFSGLQFGLLLMTHNSKDCSWGKAHANNWQYCDAGFKILGDGGQSVQIDGGTVALHTRQVGFQGPNPQETNDANHFRCDGLKFDTQQTTGAGCMGFDLGQAKYVYLAGHSFEIEGTSTTRAIRLGTTGGCTGTISGVHIQHNDGSDGTGIELVGSTASNPASVTVLGGTYTNLAEDVHIGPFAQGCQVIGGTHNGAKAGKKGVVIDNNSSVLGTVIVGFSSARQASSLTLLSIPSGSDTRYTGCWDYANGTPKWWTDGVINKKAGAPSASAGAEFPAFQDGQMQLDTTNHRLYVRESGAWKFAALT